MRGRTAGKGLKGKPMSSSDVYQISTNDRSHQPEPTSNRPAERSAMTPFNVVLLSAVGVILGGAAVLNFSPLGSLGRYQVLKGDGSTVIRMDTATGELSLCYGFALRKPKCLPWGHDEQPYRTPEPPQTP